MTQPARRTRRPLPRRYCLEALEIRTLLSAGVGTFSPDTVTWSLRSTASPGPADVGTFQFGIALPVVGDWNGDGVDDIGSFNKSTATWSLHYGASEGFPDAGVFQFGTKGSLPVVGDWNGDGRDDIGVFNPANATWSLRFGASGGPATAGTFKFGTKNTIPVVGDWNGDGTDGIGTFDPAKFTWTLKQKAFAGVPDAGTFKFGSGKNPLPVVGDWNGDGKDGIGIFDKKTTTWSLRQIAAAGAADVGTFKFGAKNSIPVIGDFTTPAPVGHSIATVTLKPLDLDLLGLKIQSSPITATVSAEAGDGKLLGNLLSTVDSVINVDQVDAALNNVLGATVDLLNSTDLSVAGVGSGAFDSATAATTQVLELFVAPVHLDLMGAHVTTSPIRLSISAEAGPGLVLGNVLTSLTNLFNPPLPSTLDVATLNAKLQQLLTDLTAQVPGIAPAVAPTPTLGPGGLLALTVPAINLDLLGLQLKTQPITVNANSQSGNGLLLGNILTTALNTIGATPDELTQLNGTVNALLAQVVGVLNASTLTLPAGALDSLSSELQTLSLPNLITAAPGATAGILNLVVQSPDNKPVRVDLLGLNVDVGNVNATLSAHTGDGLVLGNLLYNVANLVNPGGPASLISLLTQLGSATTSNLGAVTTGLSPTAGPETPLLTLTLPPLDQNLLGLEVQTTDPITVTLKAQEGNGLLLGNVLTAVSSLLNLQGVGNALTNVLSTTVGLLNSADLSVTGVLDGILTPAAPSTTTVLDAAVAPVHLDLLGLAVDTTPIHLTITAHSGDGLLLGNVLTELTNLFNPPLPATLDLATINTKLEQLLSDLTAQIPGIPAAVSPPPVLGENGVLALTVPAINLDLLGLLLRTDPITVNATAQTGDGLLLGNILKTALNSLGATPAQLTELNGNLNGLLAQVVGVLNASTLTLPANVLSTLSPALQTLASTGLITAAPGATASILDLAIATSDGSAPVNLNLLGVNVTTSNINLQLSAQTGDGLILGNLLYNVSNLLNSGGQSGSLLSLLSLLGL